MAIFPGSWKLHVHPRPPGAYGELTDKESKVIKGDVWTATRVKRVSIILHAGLEDHLSFLVEVLSYVFQPLLNGSQPNLVRRTTDLAPTCHMTLTCI